jgi:hypothetical protein
VRTLVLQITPGSEPIEGILRAPDGTEQEFFGTLGLLAAIEALREQEVASAAPPESERGLDAPA